MTTCQKFAAAFTIFAKYETSDYSVCAEHDKIHVNISKDLVTTEDFSTLLSLGWDYNYEDSFYIFT